MSTELFYTINLLFNLAMSTIGLIISFLMILIIIINRECRTITNLLICDMCFSMILYFILCIIGYIYGLREDWLYYQPTCSFRAYCITVACTACCYSFLIQAISRLFFAVLYKYKYLLTWRTHWILIILKWFISFLISIEPFFIKDGFGLIEEHRTCVSTIKVLSVSLYTSFVIFMFPVNCVIVIYGIILKQVRQSTRRIKPLISSLTAFSINTNNSSPLARRNLKVMQNMLILLSIPACGGTPYLVIIIWNLIKPQSVLKEYYVLCASLITLSFTTMITTLLLMNKTIKRVILRYLGCLQLCTS